jgi:hypothetical protein
MQNAAKISYTNFRADKNVACLSSLLKLFTTFRDIGRQTLAFLASLFS